MSLSEINDSNIHCQVQPFEQNFPLQGSFHQGDDRFSVDSQGKQCLPCCISFLLTIFSKPIDNSDWSSYDIDKIICVGDCLYNSVGNSAVLRHSYLLPADIPNYISIQNKYYKWTVKETWSGNMKNMNDIVNPPFIFNLDHALLLCMSLSKYAIFVCKGYAVALFKVRNSFIVFDSHARNHSGLPDVDGKSTMSLLKSLSNLCSFLRGVVQSFSSTTDECLNEQFDLHYIDIKNISRRTFIKQKKQNFLIPPTFDSEYSQLLTNVPYFQDGSQLHCDKMYNILKGSGIKNVKRKCHQVQHSEIDNKNQKLDEDVDSLETDFQKLVSEGPEYVCTSCCQLFFRHSVVCFLTCSLSAEITHECIAGIKSVKNKEWICQQCMKYLKAGKIPPCSGGNKLSFPEVPVELQCLTELEERLISPRIPFMQIRENPRGGQLGIKGNVVNVPADVNNTVSILPRNMGNSETIPVKLKRKKSYKSYVAFECVRPQKIIDAAKWLVSNSKLFQSEGITVNDNWINEIHSELPNTSESEFENCNNLSQEKAEENEVCNSDNWSEDDEQVTADKHSGNLDTVMYPADYREFNRILNVAPAEGNTPLGIFTDKNAEFLAFPKIYCGFTRQNNNERNVPLHYSTICKWELRNIDRRVAKNVANIFFKLKKLQIKQIADKVSLAVRKCKLKGKQLTVNDILTPSSFEKILKMNEGYRVLRTLRGSPPYWEQSKKDIFAMIRQLGIPTWFCSFSAAETKWETLLRILAKLVDQRCYTNADIESLTWEEKCHLIKSDPVTCARYFDYRFRKFLNKVLKHQKMPVGKIQDFFYRVEFQQRGSPHIHMLMWIESAPTLKSSSDSDIFNFVNSYVTCKNDETIEEFVNYQTHRHSSSCRKKGKSVCRFGFPIPPVDRTMILRGYEQESNQQMIAKSHFDKIMKVLETKKLGKDSPSDLKDFISSMGLTYDEYINALRASVKPGTAKIFLERNLSEIRINNYNKTLMKCWQANMDIQFILDPYACASYIVSYVSKGQRGMSNLLSEACKEARETKSDIREQVRRVGNVFLNHIEIGAQEAVYLVLQMALRQASRQITFINTNLPENRVALIKPMSVLQELPKNSTSIESDTVLNQYQRRPKSMELYCLADYVALFDCKRPVKETCRNDVIGNKVSESDCLPEEVYEIDVTDNTVEDTIITDEVDTVLSTREEHYSKNDGSVFLRRKHAKVLRYVRFNKEHDKENYYRELIMLFTSWRNENELMGKCTTYEEWYHEIENSLLLNKKRYENCQISEMEEIVMECSDLEHPNDIIAADIQHNELVDAEEGNISSQQFGCFDPGTCYENNVNQEYDVAIDLGTCIARKHICANNEQIADEVCDEEFRSMAQHLNKKQFDFFYHVLHWHKTCNKPLYNFLTGGAGVGKSVLLKTLYQALIKYFAHQVGENPDDLRVLICAPTGKAAYNVGGSTVHTAFCIPAQQGFHYKPLDMQQLCNYQTKFRALKIVFIDEISMVGNRMFQYINLRLQEIKGTTKPFGGVSVIAFGDLFQLKPVMDGWVFDCFHNEGRIESLATNLWKDLFQVFELDEIMRQKDDREFAQLLNRLREGFYFPEDIACLKSRIIKNETEFTKAMVHLYTQRKQVAEYNCAIFSETVSRKKTVVKSIDSVSGDISEQLKLKIISKIPNDTAKTKGLSESLSLAEDLPAELCTNIDVNDGMTNGTPCCIQKLDFRVPNSSRCSIVWVEFTDATVGKLCRNRYAHLYNNTIDKKWTPILEITRQFQFNFYKSFNIIRRQFPLCLASAKTVHKSQGSTLPDIVVHFGNAKIDHIHYVALSRVRNLSSLHILELNENKISISQSVQNEMERLRTFRKLTPSMPCLHQYESNICKFKIAYHNCRSLHKHISDVKHDINLISVDVLAFSETRLCANDNSEHYQISDFSMYRCDDRNININQVRPFHGLAVYSKIQQSNFQSFSCSNVESVLAHVTKENREIQICFLYCSPKNSTLNALKEFFKQLSEVWDISKPTIILGDTNVDLIRTSEFSKHVHSKYSLKQLITHPTTNYGSLLDHIYTNIDPQDIIDSGMLESYFSDHKPIYIVIN